MQNLTDGVVELEKHLNSGNLEAAKKAYKDNQIGFNALAIHAKESVLQKDKSLPKLLKGTATETLKDPDFYGKLGVTGLASGVTAAGAYGGKKLIDVVSNKLKERKTKKEEQKQAEIKTASQPEALEFLNRF
jgi:hypothetical protein